MRSRSAALGLLLALTYSAHAAAEEPTGTGQEPPPTAPAEASTPALTGMTEADAKAAELYRQGAAALKAGRHEEAYDKFQQAWQLKKHFQLAANLGAVELRLGKHRDAAEHLAYFMREAPDAFQEERQQLEQMLTEARQHVGALKVQVEPGAEVFVDGRSVGTAPLERELFLEPGRRVVEARRAGFERAQADVEASAGTSLMVRIALKRAAPVTKGPDVRGPVGGARAGDQGLEPTSVNWPAIAAGGVALAGIGVGVGFTLAANARDQEADNLLREAADRTPRGQSVCDESRLTGRCSRLNGLLEEETRFARGAMAGYVVGGVAAAVAAGLVIWQPQHTGGPGRTAKVAPSLSLDGGGLLVDGTF